jgi:hypothetical protein
MPKVTLSELLLALAFFGMGCAALKYADSPWWRMILAWSVLLLFMAAVVIALVDRGQRQASAAGFASCVAIYGVLLWSEVQLPTSDVLKLTYQAVAAEKHVVVPVKGFSPYGTGPGGMSMRGMAVSLTELSPGYEGFATNGHLLWVLLFGYFGARLATFVRRRRDFAIERNSGA